MWWCNPVISGSARSSWRDHREYPERGGGFSTYKAPTGFESRERFRSGRGSGSWDDENDPDNLPDWCNDDKEDMENIGTFDSSGAFMSLKVRKVVCSGGLFLDVTVMDY